MSDYVVVSFSLPVTIAGGMTCSYNGERSACNYNDACEAASVHGFSETLHRRTPEPSEFALQTDS